ncbi:MAG: hypothetical protein QHH06_02835 [Clostridiales bacterium]|jgi:hypothetical protein|nr:hypothetical protein [Eubacteriales bacterium]MDH7565405.1 hypothetical protein [Clostridiales bacterium]
MDYIHISNDEVLNRGRIDANKIYLDDKEYRIISFELATGDFIVEEIPKDMLH